MLNKILFFDNSPTNIAAADAILAEQNIELKNYNDTIRAAARVREYNPDVIVLDYRLCMNKQHNLCKEFRVFFNGPIIVLSSVLIPDAEAESLSSGADDYILKNRDIETVVIPRIKRHFEIWERFNQISQPHPLTNFNIEPIKEYVAGRYKYCVKSNCIFDGSTPLNFSDLEMHILKTTGSKSPEPVSKEEIFASLGRQADINEQNNIQCIYRLRQKLIKYGFPKGFLKTVRNKGIAMDIGTIM